MENEKLLSDIAENWFWGSDTLGKDYSPEILETLWYSKEYLEAMSKNYPDHTLGYIIECIENQKDCLVCFHHLHEGISWGLIKKYLIIDEDVNYPLKVTLETDELHNCNLVELTPELQGKAYRWYRWNRSTVSHLIDKKDYQKENKTRKLTIIGYRSNWPIYVNEVDEYYEGYFNVITAFWWDWSSKREPWSWYLSTYNSADIEYRMNHALIPESNERITKCEEPFRATEYNENKNW